MLRMQGLIAVAPTLAVAVLPQTGLPFAPPALRMLRLAAGVALRPAT
jgi:hypothetical protein